MSLGPGIPAASSPLAQQSTHRHRIPAGHTVRRSAVLGGLHHEYWLEVIAASDWKEFLRNTGKYEGQIDANGSIAGSWSQNGTTWPLIWYRGEDPGVTLRPFDEDEALRKGRTYTQWFYEGTASDLWTRLSPVMQHAVESPQNLDELCDRTRRGIGKESSLTRESVSLSGAIRVCRRLAKFDKSDDVEVTFGFDSRGAIAQFEVRSGEKQLRPL